MPQYKVTASSLNIRSGPGTSYKSLGTVSMGTILEIESDTKYGDNNNWLKLKDKFKGSVAYASASYLKKVTSPSAGGGYDGSKLSNSEVTTYSATGKLVTDTLLYHVDGFQNDNGVSASKGVIVKKGESVKILAKSNTGWYFISSENSTKVSGWIPQSVVNITKGNKVIEYADKESVEYNAAKNYADLFKSALTEIKTDEFDEVSYDILIKDDSLSAKSAKKILVKNLNGIHGVPYQFMDTVDRRYDSDTSLGRKYVERILSKMPLLLMTPGEPDFLPSYSKEEKNVILGALLGDKTDLDKILNTSGRYYTFKFNYAEYYEYVNSMLQMCAIYLGIQDKYHGNGYNKGYRQTLGSFRWEKAVNSELRGFINSQEYVAFYLDSETSISESISNDTDRSQIADLVNSFSAISRELQFLAGPISGIRVEALSPEDYNATLEDIQDLSRQIFGRNRLFDNLTEQFTTVGKGGKIAFPEIWSDSEYSKTYEITIKLRTPDADKLSWYLNICVPLIHLLGMAAPRQMGPNGYRAPFLVRAYYKGLFNCDMGIITNMSITKGKEGAWTVDGLPTEVDVNISLKDLYSMLSITNAKKTGVKNFLNNTCLMDYLANTCGVNINKAEIARTLDTYVLLTKNNMQSIYGSNWLKLQNGLSNLAASAYKKFASQTN